MNSGTPFQIFASTKNPEGYEYIICIECNIG